MASSAARKLIPKKLQDDLQEIPRYKPLSTRKEIPGVVSQNPRSLREVLDDSVERAMYDEIMGPIVNSRSKMSARPNTVASPPNSRTCSGNMSSYGENLINANSSGLFKKQNIVSSLSPSQLPASSSTSPMFHGYKRYTDRGEKGELKENGNSTSPKISPRMGLGNGNSSSLGLGLTSSSSSSSSFNDSILVRLTSVESENKQLRKQLSEKVILTDKLQGK